TIKTAGSQEAFRRVDYGYPEALAAWATRRGAVQFAVVSSVGADPSSGNFYLRVKGEMERDLTALGFPSLHIFRPSLLVGERAESRPGERIATAMSKVIGWALIGGLRKYRPIAAAGVAAAMVAACRQGTPGEHVYHYDEIRVFLRPR